MDNFIQGHPAVVSYVLGAMGLLLAGTIGVIFRLVWVRVTGGAFITVDRCSKMHQELLGLVDDSKRDLRAGDTMFLNLVEGQRVLALTMRDICNALNTIMDAPLDCHILDGWITHNNVRRRHASRDADKGT